MAPVSRSKVGSTNSNRGVERRQFIRTAAGSAAGIVLGGPPLLAACTSTDPGVSVVSDRQNATTVPNTTASTTTTTTPADSTAPPTTSGVDDTLAATVWRLSTRSQRGACAACKAHAAHRYFATDALADAGRAHSGCSCKIREQPTTVGQLQTWFATNAEVFDDRWVL